VATSKKPPQVLQLRIHSGQFGSDVLEHGARNVVKCRAGRKVEFHTASVDFLPFMA
jgi:hypothetical protein